MSRSKKKFIHVNTHRIRQNAASTCDIHQPVITVKQGQENNYAHEVDLCLPDGTVVARLCYHPDDPLKCGARVWLETELEVKLHEWPNNRVPLAQDERYQ